MPESAAAIGVKPVRRQVLSGQATSKTAPATCKPERSAAPIAAAPHRRAKPLTSGTLQAGRQPPRWGSPPGGLAPTPRRTANSDPRMHNAGPPGGGYDG